MIIALLSDIWSPSSVDRGRSGFALGLVDRLALVLVLLVVDRRERGLLVLAELGGAVAARRLDGRSTRVTRCRRTSSVMRRLRSSSAIASPGASNRTMWYEPSRYRSIG